MKKTKIAIYTSFYNSEEYIDSVFDNINNINYDNFTWFITDDFSDDNTLELITKKSKNNPKIKLVTQQHKKEMYWRPNTFIPSDYEYIMLMCVDDIVNKEILNIYNYYINKHNNDLSILSVDFSKIDEISKGRHSNGYVINNDFFIRKLDTYHPKIDYLENLSYYAFGHAMCFKNTDDLFFEIDDFNASAEDSYRLMYMHSKGQWLHIPRNLYTWTYRDNSESHSIAKSNFNGNFHIAFEKLKNNPVEPIYYFNTSYKEFNSLISINELDNYKNISIFSPNIDLSNKTKIKELYFDKNIHFNEINGCQLYIIILNYYKNKNSLKTLLETIKNNNNPNISIVLYYMDDEYYYEKNELDNSVNTIKETAIDIHSNIFGTTYFFIYFRHLILTNKSYII